MASYQGRRYDAELGLYYYRNRYYDPIHGRFTSRDPLGFWGDPANMGNPYTFLANNLWSFLDPWGLCGMTREQLERQLQELMEDKDGDALAAFLDDLWDNKEAQTENIGVFNPVGDLARAGIALDEGDYWGVAENLVGTVPIVGDGAKLVSKGARKVLGVGFEYSDEVMMGMKSGANALPRGGTYMLRDQHTGNVMRTGRTKDLDRRTGEHARDPNTRP